MKSAEEERFKKRQRQLRKLIVSFFIMMIFFTFFSKTINKLSLPKVNVDTVSGGVLIKKLYGQGKVEVNKAVEIYTTIRRRIRKLFVEQGEYVKKEQILAVLDAGALNEAVDKYVHLYEKGDLNQEELYKVLARESLWEVLIDLDRAEHILHQASKEYARSEELFKHGYLSDRELNAKDFEYKQRLWEYNKIEYRKEIEFKDQIGFFKNIVFITPIDGYVTELIYDVNTYTHSYEPFIKIANPDKGYLFRTIIDYSFTEYISIGERVDVYFTKSLIDSLEGTVKGFKRISVEPNEREMIIELPFTEKLFGGEAGELFIEKRTRYYNLMVPLSSIIETPEGHIVYVLKEKKGVLGKEYYVLEMNIQVMDEDSCYAAVSAGLSPYDTVVVNSSKPLENGKQVVVETEVI